MLAPSVTQNFPETIIEKISLKEFSSATELILNHPELKEAILNKVYELIDDECSTVCSTKEKSLFRHFNDSTEFEWKDYVCEIKAKAPTLYSIMSKIVSHCDKRNSRTIEYHYPGICTAMAVLLKDRNKNMVGLQTVISLLLFSSNVQKQVCSRTLIHNAVQRFVSWLHLAQIKVKERLSKLLYSSKQTSI